MSETIENFDWPHKKRRARRRDSAYPLDTWFNGETWKIVQGVDFECGVASIRTLLHHHAKKRNLEVRSSLQEGNNFLVFQTMGEDTDV